MSSGSFGSHRAFMGVCVTLCVCLVLTLFVGWKWYFESLSSRNTLIEMAKKAETRVRELENMGLSVEAAKSAIDPPAATPKIVPADTASAPKTPAPPQDVPRPEESAIKEMPLMETSDDVIQAVALLEQYWKTEVWKDKLPLVIHSDRVAPLMRDFYETQEGTDQMPGGLLGKARYMIGGTEILYFSYTSSRPNGSLEVALLRGPEGKFLIDWESLTGYGEKSFREFREKRPTKPVTLRCYARLFEYFNFEFSDPKKHLCVKLTSENGESSIYAYCERGTELSRWLEADLATTGPNGFKGYTLQVSFPPEAQSNQCVYLHKVLKPRWLAVP